MRTRESTAASGCFFALSDGFVSCRQFRSSGRRIVRSTPLASSVVACRGAPGPPAGSHIQLVVPLPCHPTYAAHASAPGCSSSPPLAPTPSPSCRCDNPCPSRSPGFHGHALEALLAAFSLPLARPVAPPPHQLPPTSHGWWSCRLDQPLAASPRSPHRSPYPPRARPCAPCASSRPSSSRF